MQCHLSIVHSTWEKIHIPNAENISVFKLHRMNIEFCVKRKGSHFNK